MAFAGSLKGSLGRLATAQNAQTITASSRNFATLQQIEMRIVSVKNIQKITKTMKMVAAAKLRGVQMLLDKTRAFSKCTDSVFNQLDEAEGGSASSASGKTVHYVTLTSDRGLCGGINSGIVKMAKKDMQEHVSTGGETKVTMVGEKARSLLQRDYGQSIQGHFTEIGKSPPNFTEASAIANQMLTVPASSAKIYANLFRSAIAYDPTGYELPTEESLDTRTNQLRTKYEFDSDCLLDLWEFHLATKTYNLLIENATSEQSARMSAMESSTKNAGEMIDKLTLLYNRSRQAAITTALIEVITGAESLNG
eukprot:TRINITY_DN37012_c0_g1_i1.p2 TRINITY_DN37012_c0_g1~~TRINITY_DN37012_c0_g1_i1.p2  ORF type:complete len:309 (-),score=100.21 TRINITY_DN37012_c0_g1_i1:396-1322(-)